MGWTIGQPYGRNLNYPTGGTPLNTGVGTFPPNAGHMVTNVQTDSPELKGSMKDASAVVQQPSNVGSVSDTYGNVPDAAVSSTPLIEPGLLGDEIPTEAPAEDEAPVAEEPAAEEVAAPVLGDEVQEGQESLTDETVVEDTAEHEVTNETEDTEALS